MGSFSALLWKTLSYASTAWMADRLCSKKCWRTRVLAEISGGSSFIVEFLYTSVSAMSQQEERHHTAALGLESEWLWQLPSSTVVRGGLRGVTSMPTLECRLLWADDDDLLKPSPLSLSSWVGWLWKIHLPVFSQCPPPATLPENFSLVLRMNLLGNQTLSLT